MASEKSREAITSSSTSWADESEDYDEPPKKTSAWSKPNPLVSNRSNEEKHEPKGNDYQSYGYDNLPTLKEAAAYDSRSRSRDDSRDASGSSYSNNRQPYQRSEYPNKSYNGYQQDRRREDARESPSYQQRENYDRSSSYNNDNRREREPYNGERERSEYSSNYRRGEFDRPYNDRRSSFSSGSRPSYGDGPREPRERREREPREQRPPREPVPFPTSPPFTAFVGNLAYEVQEDELYKFFEPESKIKGVRLLINRDTGRGKGYGYVEFEDLESLQTAVSRSGQIFLEREIKIDVAEQREEKKRESFWGNTRGPREFGGAERSRERDREDEPVPDSDEPARERKKLELKPRSSEPEPVKPSTSTAPASEPKETSPRKSKSNPFGEAKPRDENAILKKKEEERRQREQKEQEEREKLEKEREKAKEKEGTTQETPPDQGEKQSPRQEEPKQETESKSPNKDREFDRRENNERRPYRSDRDRPPRRDDRRPPRDDFAKGGDIAKGEERPAQRRDYGDRPRRGGFNNGERRYYNTTRDDSRRRDDREAPRPPKKDVAPPKPSGDEVRSKNLFSALGEEDE